MYEGVTFSRGEVICIFLVFLWFGSAAAIVGWNVSRREPEQKIECRCNCTHKATGQVGQIK